MGGLVITPATHLDHGLTKEHLLWLKAELDELISAERIPEDKVRIGTLTLPPELEHLYTGLIEDVPEIEVRYAVREGRKYASRLCTRLHVETRELSYVFGPDGDVPYTLYTAYGGKLGTQEPGDPSISSWELLEHARAFWATHALTALPHPTVVTPAALQDMVARFDASLETEPPWLVGPAKGE